jgi:glycosyltransferase involved in cell wall biosynthesis
LPLRVRAVVLTETDRQGFEKRKVLHVLDYWRNLDARYFYAILERHSRAYDVAFCLLDEGPGGPWTGGRFGGHVVTLGARRRLQYPAATIRLAARLRRDGHSLVHAHFFYPTFVAILAGRLAGVPVVFTRHHSDHNIRLHKPWHVRIDGWCARAASQVIAVSWATKKLMVAVEHVPEDQVSVIHNGMDLLPPPSSQDIERVRAELAPGTSRICLMIARLHEEKGHRVLFEAIPGIVARGPCSLLARRRWTAPTRY